MRGAGLVVVLVAALLGALRAAVMKEVPGDFLRYHRAGRLVVTGRADLIYDAAFLRRQEVYAAERVAGGDPLLEQEFKYAPATAVLMAPLGALPARTADTVWGAWNAALIAWIFVAAWQWCAARVPWWFVVVPLAACARVVASNMSLAQLNPSAIAPATLGLIWLARRRDVAAGAAIGLGAVVKFLPGLLAVWLVVKRRWRAFVACMLVVLCVGVGLPTIVLGPSGSLDLDARWLAARSHVYTSAAAADVPGYSVKSFVYRVMGDVPYATFSDESKTPLVVGAGLLEPSALRALTLAVDALLLALVLWRTRGASRDEEDPRAPLEAAAWLAILPLVSPEARYPHFLFLALGFVAVACELYRGGLQDARRKTAAALAVVAAASLYVTSDKVLGARGGLIAEAWCAPGWGALALLAALLVLMRSQSRAAAL